MKIATWNVNSVKARSAHLTRWLARFKPDIVMLQEIKCQTEDFPILDVKALGYEGVAFGQKAYNGVALLATRPITEVMTGLPGDDGDVQARYIEATVGDLRVASIYLPNGNPAPGDKYDYKLAWMERLTALARERLELEEPLILAGDFNAIPTPADVHDPELWKDDALYLPATRAKFRALTHLGLVDAVRATSDEAGLYTFWDYQGNSFAKNNGIRIDHLLLSPRAADKLAQAGIDRPMRGGEKPSDHVPVWVDLELETR